MLAIEDATRTSMYEQAYGLADDASQVLPQDGEPSRPPLRVEIIEALVGTLRRTLDENADEVAEDGGAQLTPDARLYVIRAGTAVLTSAALNPNFSVEDFALTPFARDDGGADLLIDLPPSNKRLTVRVGSSGGHGQIAQTSALGAEGVFDLRRPEDIVQYVGWLTRLR